MSPIEVVEANYEAYNAGDADRLAALYAEILPIVSLDVQGAREVRGVPVGPMAADLLSDGLGIPLGIGFWRVPCKPPENSLFFASRFPARFENFP